MRLLSGPGCPVCVTPAGAIDAVLRLCEQPGVTVASYGDLLRVPGSVRGDTLLRRRALGASVLAYVFFNQGIQAIGASRASSFINLVPVITAGLAFILLGERPDFSQLLGSAVILLGVSLSQYGWPRWLAARVAAAS